MTGFKKVILIFLALAISACNFPELAPIPVAALPDAVKTPGAKLVLAASDLTPSATPFQPLPPTPVFTPTEIPTLTPIPTPTSTPFVLPSEIADQVYAKSPDQMIILLLGSDKRPWDTGFRTDTIVLLVLNPKQGTASLLSFPRDLWVDIPGVGQERINTAFYNGGFKTLAATLEHNFGVRPDSYLLINFRSFKQIVDSLGGLDVRVGQPVKDRYPGKGWITIPKGENHMNADMVLWYARSRKTTNDFARNRRQQEVLLALYEKMFSLEAVKKAPDIFNKYRKSVITNLEVADLLPLIPLAIQVMDTSRIKRYYIEPQNVWDWITPGGAMVLLPKEDEIRNLVRKALKGK